MIKWRNKDQMQTLESLELNTFDTINVNYL